MKAVFQIQPRGTPLQVPKRTRKIRSGIKAKIKSSCCGRGLGGGGRQLVPKR